MAGDRKLSERFALVHGHPPFMLELGTRWNRYDFSWSGIERPRGNLDFRDLPEQVDESLRNGVMILPILDYEPAWNPEHSPADEETLALWERYVETTVARFKGKLRYWQAWNEPNIGFWKPVPNPRDYAELLRRTWLAAKRADPDAQIVGVNCSGIDLAFTEKVFRYGGLKYCDVLAYQPYRIAPEVGHFEEVEALRKLVGRFGEPRPIWFTEMGWNSDHFPFSDAADLLAERPSRRQAAFLVRYMVLIQAAGIDKVFWFSQSAGGHGLDAPKQGKKRLSFYAYRHLIELLDDYEQIHELVPRGSSGQYAYLFTLPDRTVVVAWSATGPQEMVLPGLSEVREARDMLGRPITIRPGKGLPINGEPVYLIFKRAPERLQELASLRVSPSRIWLAPGQEERLTLRNTTGVEDMNVSIGVSPGVHTSQNIIDVPREAQASVTITADPKAQPGLRRILLERGSAQWPVEVNIMPRVLWTHQGSSQGYLTPTLLRDVDGTPSVLIAAYDTGELLCLSSNGEVHWRYEAGAPINDSVTVSNVTGDARPEIVAAMPSRQTVFALNIDGVLQWRARLPGKPPNDTPAWRWTRPVAVDLNGDGPSEIIYADTHGTVSVLSGTGEFRWQQKISDHRCDRPVTAADVLGDAQREVLVGDEAGRLYCVSAEGKVVWTVDAGGDITARPTAGVVEPGEAPGVFVGTKNERLVRISSRGKTIWSVKLGGTMDLGTGIVLTDLDGDGVREVVASTRNHEVIACSATGELLWRVETGAQLRSIPAVGDVDGDGENEILIGSADWLLYAIDPRGDVKWTVNVGNRVDGSPLLVDLDADGVQDIVLPVRGGKILALSTGKSKR